MGLIRDFAESRGLISRYTAGNEISNALVEVGQMKVSVPQAELIPDEVDRLVTDLDAAYRTRGNEEVAAIVAEATPAIIAALRWAKNERNGEYTGISGVGQQMVATPLRAIYVGNTSMTNTVASASSKGAYAGTNAAVYSWLPSTTWTAGSNKVLFPSQKMGKDSAIVWCGYAEQEEIPAVDGVSFGVSGQTTPITALNFQTPNRHSIRSPAVAKLQKPVIFGPDRTCVNTLYAGKTKNSEPVPVAVLITAAEFLIV